MKNDFHEILINLDVVDCRGFVFRESPKNGGVRDFERNRHFEKSVENGRGAGVPPVARYPTTSDGGGAILCPLAEALGARLAEHPIGLGDGAVVVGDTVAVGSLGTRLEGTATVGVGLCQVQQEGGTVGADHLGTLEQESSHTLGVAHESGEAGGGDDLEHRSRGGGWWRSVPLA